LSNRINLKADATVVTTGLDLKLNKVDTSYLLQKSDTSTLSNRIDLKADATVVATGLDLKLNKADTSYLLQKSDTSTLSNRIDLKADALTVTSGLDLKLNKVDTSYLLQKSDTSTLSNRINLKLNISDTSLLFQKSDTSTLSNRIDLKLNKLGESVAIGNNAGISNQDINAVAIGTNAGQNTQSSYSVALGWNAGQTSQATGAVAIGSPAGQTNQGINSVAIGNGAGQTNQGSQSVVIGLNAGQTNQGVNAISIGAYSQASFSNSTALGYQAVTTASNTIQLGADGTGGTTAITNVKTSGTLTAGDVTYPNAHGISGQVLTTSGTGTLAWANANDLTTGLTLKLNTADTSYLLQKSDTSTLSNRIDLKFNITDTSLLFQKADTSYLLQKADTSTLSNRIDLKFNFTDTSLLFQKADTSYLLQKADTSTLSNRINLKANLASPTFTGTITAANQTLSGTLGIGTISPNSSAVLEVSSTTRGFLPPRMTTIQRDSITGLVEGLTIWNKTNKQLEVYDGSYWVNMNGKLVSTLNIGDSYGGGKVAYIFTSSDLGYIAGQTHGLIAAISDQTSDVGVKWFPDKFYGATGTLLGLGSANTISIIAAAVVLGTTDLTTFAAGIASSHRGGGYTDWYLPSKDELNKLYTNRVAIGGFATSGSVATYWSSSQKGALSYTNFDSFKTGISSAYQQFFFTYNGNSEGLQNDLGINNLRRVRAVRIF